MSTLQDKSMGCAQKARQPQVIDVLSYGERLYKPGRWLFSKTASLSER
ncbi:hypothetical protein [Parendozoicomonas sp. Alg238-R29]